VGRADDAIANTLGVSPALVRKLRVEKMTKGEDYSDDGRVLYTPAGEFKLRELLGALEASEKKEGAAKAVGPFCRGLVNMPGAVVEKKEGGAGGGTASEPGGRQEGEGREQAATTPAAGATPTTTPKPKNTSKKNPPPKRTEPEETESTLIKRWPNPIWVRVRLKNGDECDVRVNNSSKAQVGMQLRVRLMPDDTCLCAHAGLMPGIR
jgi:hypothetical protein